MPPRQQRRLQRNIPVLSMGGVAHYVNTNNYRQMDRALRNVQSLPLQVGTVTTGHDDFFTDHNATYFRQNGSANLLVRHRNSRGDYRYFRRTVRVQGGDTIGVLMNEFFASEAKARKEMDLADRPDYDLDGDLEKDEFAYELVDINFDNINGAIANQVGRVTENFDQDPDLWLDIGAFHQYQKIPLERFAIRQLILRTFTCIYESLMIILKHKTEGYAPEEFPNISLKDWKIFVLLHFNQETFKVQQMFWDGNIISCLNFFESKYDIKVQLFNAYFYKAEMEKIQQLETANPELASTYFLAYWGEHVFPCHRQALDKLVEFQDQNVLRLNSSHELLFMICPAIFKFLFIEIRTALCEEQVDQVTGQNLALNKLGEFLHRALPNFTMRDIFYMGQLLKENPFKIGNQQKILEGYYQDRDKDEIFFYQKFLEQIKDLPQRKRNCIGGKFNIIKAGLKSLYFSPAELELYKELTQYVTQQKARPNISEEELEMIEKEACQQSDVYNFSYRRRHKFFKKGRAVIDLETYIDNSEERQTYYNMVPFCASLVGELQQKYTEYVTDAQGNVRRLLKVRLVKNINKIFLGLHPKECIKKLVRFLMDNNFCYVQDDYTDLQNKGPKDKKEKRLYNYIFAHNGFGFDFKFIYEELHSLMREFQIVGDVNSTKQLRGNGLFFYDFSLIYKEKLKSLTQTFFPDDPSLQKKECQLIVNLEREVIQGWYEESKHNGWEFQDHPQMKEIIEYCRQDSLVLFKIVNKFFCDTYSTPFGFSFLPNPFYHSLSSMAYSMFTNCYLTKPIFVNKEVLQIELDTKMGGCTGTNCHKVGVGVFIDENSFYPAIMKNMMPVEYVNPLSNTYENFEEVVIVTNRQQLDQIKPYNIYKIAFRFPQHCRLPTIAQKAFDTLIMVRETDDFDEEDPLKIQTIFTFGYSIMVAMSEYPDTVIKVFGQVQYVPGDFIFRDFIEDQYTARLQAKERGDGVADKFHKNIMNSAQGKLGQMPYENVVFGSAPYIRDRMSELVLQEGISDINVKQILSDNIDLFEMKWSHKDDKWQSQGNTVRLPSYIMSVARSHLLRIQNVIARAFNDPNCIAYYDTDSVLARFDLANPQLDQRVQLIFDSYLLLEAKAKQESQKVLNIFKIIFDGYLKKMIIQEIGQLIEGSPQMQLMKNLQIQDVTRLHEDVQVPLLDELLLGACKVEKYVIRGLMLGAKQYGVYYLEKARGKWILKMTVKLKGVRPEARKYQLLEDIEKNIKYSDPDSNAMDELKEIYRNNQVQQVQEFIYKGDDRNCPLPVAITDQMTKWSRMGAGTLINDVVKIVRPTLSKRLHSIEDGTSVPFKNPTEFHQYKLRYEAHAKQLQRLYRSGIQDLLVQIKQSSAYKAVQDATASCNIIRNQSRQYFKECVKNLTESRKRYLIHVSKIKYDQIQDEILDLILNNENFFLEFSLYMEKLISISYFAMINRKKNSKKGCHDMHGDQGSNFSMLESSRIIAFTLFLYYFFKKYSKRQAIPKNFDLIAKMLVEDFILPCTSLNEQERVFVDMVQRPNRTQLHQKRGSRSWNYSIVYAFEFLQSGVSIYREKQANLKYLTEICEQLDFEDIDNNYELRLEYTSLWRTLNNALTHSLDLKYSQQRGSIDFRGLQENLRIFEENILEEDERLLHSDGRNLALMVGDFDLLNVVRHDQCDLMDLEQRERQDYQATDKDMEVQGTFVDRKVRNILKQHPLLLVNFNHWMEKNSEENERINGDPVENDLVNIIRAMQPFQEVREDVSDYVHGLSIFQLLKDKLPGFREEDDNYLQQLFNLSTKTKKKLEANKDDLMDLLHLFLFLKAGGKDAAILMYGMGQQIKEMLKDYARDHKKLFVKVCRVLFSRPRMFQLFVSDRLSNKTNNIVKFFIDMSTHCQIEHVRKMTREEYDQYFKSLVIGDKARLNELLHDIFTQCYKNQFLSDMGQQIFQKVLSWRNPSPAMVRTLKTILLLDQTMVVEQEQPQIGQIFLVEKVIKIFVHENDEEQKLSNMEEFKEDIRPPMSPVHYRFSEMNEDQYEGGILSQEQIRQHHQFIQQIDNEVEDIQESNLRKRLRQQTDFDFDEEEELRFQQTMFRRERIFNARRRKVQGLFEFEAEESENEGSASLDFEMDLSDDLF